VIPAVSSRRRDEGSYSVELAIITPALLLLIFFVVQVSLFLYGRSVALQSAREGVSQLRLAQTQEDFLAAEPGVHDTVVAFATNVGSGSLTNPVVVEDYNDVGGRVTVKVTGTTISLIPFATFHVSESASGTVERFQ
jgi:Flp pilus assembly protein TadG